MGHHTDHGQVGTQCITDDLERSMSLLAPGRLSDSHETIGA